MAGMVDDFLKGYTDHLKATGAKSLYHYRSHARIFLRWLASKNLPLATLTAQQLNDYLCYRKASGLGAHTLKNDLDKLRHFLRYGRQQGLISRDPTVDVSRRWLTVPGGYTDAHN